jgi:hypothetical protein
MNESAGPRTRAWHSPFAPLRLCMSSLVGWPDLARDAKAQRKNARRQGDRLSFLPELPNAFSLLIILLLAVNYFSPFADLDFAWQVRTGEQIVRTGQLCPPDAFTYTIAGQHLPDFEWLYELVLWGIWSLFGFGGLKLLKVVLVFAPMLIVGLRLRREGVGWHGIAAALLMAATVTSPAWNLRPMYCTTIGLLLVTGWLRDQCRDRAPAAWWLPAVLFLWGNLHPGVIVGQGVLAGAIGLEWLNRWLRWVPPLSAPRFRRLTMVGGLALAASLIAPHPVERLLYPFQAGVSHPVQRIFTEMQPLYRCWDRQPLATALAYSLATLVGVTVIVRFRHYRLWEVALLAGLTVLINLAVRSLLDWIFILLAVGVPRLKMLVLELHERYVSGRRARMRSSLPAPPGERFRLALATIVVRSDRFLRHMFRQPFLRWQSLWPALGFGLLLLVSLIPRLSRRMPRQNASEWPVRAVDWIEVQGIEGRFFSPPDFGSYLIWRLGGQGRTYVDTRGFFFPPQLLEDSNYLPQMEPGWQKRLDMVLASGTDYFLLEPHAARGQLWNALEPYIQKPLYRDEQAVLLSAKQVKEAAERIAYP